jgi:hypothetical protein
MNKRFFFFILVLKIFLPRSLTLRNKDPYEFIFMLLLIIENFYHDTSSKNNRKIFPNHYENNKILKRKDRVRRYI